jgi:hypothetical protein
VRFTKRCNGFPMQNERRSFSAISKACANPTLPLGSDGLSARSLGVCARRDRNSSNSSHAVESLRGHSLSVGLLFQPGVYLRFSLKR